MYNCFDIAKQFLRLAYEEGIDVEPMKLLKLTYIAHGWHLGFYGKPLINNGIEAWKYGPVIPELYHVTKRFGFSNVDLETIDLYSESNLQGEDLKFVNIIWNNYKKFSGLDLSAKTHIEGSPWSQVYDGSFNKLIDNSVIEEYYKKFIESSKNAEQPK